MDWKNEFNLEYYYCSIVQPAYMLHYKNLHYNGGELRAFFAPAELIDRFLTELYNANPCIVKTYIKEVKFDYILPNSPNKLPRSYVYGDREFLDSLILESGYDWSDDDEAWRGRLIYDRELLSNYVKR